MFLSRNYRMIVAPWKFDVLKTNICPRSEASRADMLVLRTSNVQGATIRPIVLRRTLYCLLFTTKFLNFSNYFQRFLMKAVKVTVKFKKENKQKPLNTISIVYFCISPPVYRSIFTDEYYPSGYFPWKGTMG